MSALLLLAVFFELNQGGVEFKVESETDVIDPAQSVFLRVELKTPAGRHPIEMPDFRDRVKGFSLVEDFEEEPKTLNDGSSLQVTNWRLVPEPCADTYKIKPFAVGDLVGGPIYFELPAVREVVTGEMEVSPSKDMPPLSWKLVAWIALWIIGAIVVLMGMRIAILFLVRKIKEHRMSPIERAWVELERLLKRELPAKGRYKDFYVELTMVVRRYIQRKYGIRAPNMTTEEFLREAKPSNELRKFLESADLVKFAGVEATLEMAETATTSARSYLKSDNAITVVAGEGNK